LERKQNRTNGQLAVSRAALNALKLVCVLSNSKSEYHCLISKISIDQYITSFEKHGNSKNLHVAADYRIRLQRDYFAKKYYFII
jgi:hypothetical protein